MAKILRAHVKAVTGRTKHSRGQLVEGLPLAVEPIFSPAWIEIESEPEGFFLLRYNSQGECIADTWHEDLGAAKRQAQFEFEILEDDWQEIKPDA